MMVALSITITFEWAIACSVVDERLHAGVVQKRRRAILCPSRSIYPAPRGCARHAYGPRSTPWQWGPR